MRSGWNLRRRGGGPIRPPYYSSLTGGAGLKTGLVFANLFNQGGGERVQSLIDHVGGAFLGSTKPTWVGQRLSFPSGAVTVASVDFGTTMRQTEDLGLGAFSVWARLVPRVSVAGGIVERNDGNTVNAGWAFNMNTSRTGLIIERATANCYGYAGVPTANKVVNIGISYDGALTSTSFSIYFDAVLQTILQSNTGSGAQGSDAARNFYVGRGTIGTVVANGCFDGLIEALYIWRRYLRAEEYRLLQVDPYAPFRDPQLAFGALAGASITSIVPSSGAQGQVSLDVLITGSQTNFVNGTTAVTFSGTGITVNSSTVADSTHVTANIDIAGGATLGARDVTVTTTAEVVIAPAGFVVTTAAAQAGIIPFMIIP